VETTLIRNFLYPKLGPGQLWEEVAKKVVAKGGEIHHNQKIIGLDYGNNRLTSATIKNMKTGAVETVQADYYFSTMPISELIHSINKGVPEKVKAVADGLIFRDFITIGLLLNELKIKNETKEKTINNIVPDTWIYIQDRAVKVGRLQIFNNWSPYLVKDSDTSWVGMEYFCSEGDELWSKSDEALSGFAIDELDSINIIDKNEVIDSTVIRVKKAYPTSFGSYDKFDLLREYVDRFENLFVIGRNGSFKYDSTDYYMLAAMLAVDNIINNVKTKDNIWEVETLGEFS
jgi:protoporphyrinogen oxidase